MANVHDYLRWRGDLSFRERAFNDVDNLILSSLCYLDFTGIVPEEGGGESIGLGDACRRLLEQSGGNVAPYVRSLAQIDAAFVSLLAQSRRFAPLLLSDYVDVVDTARALQFSAMQIDLAQGETYVAFRGTDDTLVGWREDFMLSFTVTEAQREAAEYLERALRRAQVRQGRVLVGGHSKGGNLAEYAAVCCPDELRGLIARVYSNDGPGMAPEVANRDGRAVLGERLKRIVPSFSVVGMIFAREDDPRTVVQSSGTGIGQHDPTTWQVLPAAFEEAQELQPECVTLNKVIMNWADGIPLDERERVTNELFDALEAGGATRFDEIAASQEGFQRVWRELSKTDERTRSLVWTLLEDTMESSMDAMINRATKGAFDQWRRSAQVVADDAVRFFQTSGGDVRVSPKLLRRGR